MLHGLRVMEGKPLYGPATPEFIPFIYPPLYSWLLALGGELWGLDYPVGRGISLLSSLFSAVVLFFAIRQEKGSWGVAVASAAFFSEHL